MEGEGDFIFLQSEEGIEGKKRGRSCSRGQREVEEGSEDENGKVLGGVHLLKVDSKLIYLVSLFLIFICYSGLKRGGKIFGRFRVVEFKGRIS
jgi:hypothetical protein